MLQKSTLDFLKALKKNNNREWFAQNKNAYEAARQNVIDFAQPLVDAMAKKNPALKGLDAKKLVMRIYRDIRFSKDKTPYKTNFGISVTPTGKMEYNAGFYLHIEPGKSFVAGGRYMPIPPALKAIRQEIEYNTKEFKSIINNKAFKKHFGTLSPMKLKTSPKGYAKDHPDLELFKYTSYIVEHSLDDKLVLSNKLIPTCAQSYAAMLPLLNFLNEATQ
jgi:uncharacterized protein (TIGR02453 family)